MKRLIALILILTFTSLSCLADDVLTFPLTLDSGKYELVVPANDNWTIYNDSAHRELRLKFADMKLLLEKQQEECKAEMKYNANLCENDKVFLKNSLNIQINSLKAENKDLRDQIGSGTILGIPKGIIYFIGGMLFAFASVSAASGIR